ncbi:MAG: acetyl-CoA carboxylase biotin carboxyl carrier protein subunit [Acutalibacteraceae bacterium]
MLNSKDELERLNLIAKILNDYSLSAVEISDGDSKYRVEKESHSAAAECDVDKENSKTKSLKDITSPLTGIFYSSISPESEAFVKAEQKFCKGDVLCVLESMKTFTEIKAEENGIIKEICVKNGDIIEYSQVLFRYIPE